MSPENIEKEAMDIIVRKKTLIEKEKEIKFMLDYRFGLGTYDIEFGDVVTLPTYKGTGQVINEDYRIDVIQEIPEMMLKDSKSKFIDDSAGSGNFLLALQTELSKYHSLSHINDNMLYAIELMEDNHAEMCKRVGVPVDHPHFVCANALEYDCSFGEPVALENHLGKMEDKKPYVVQPVKHESSQAAPLF